MFSNFRFVVCSKEPSRGRLEAGITAEKGMILKRLSSRNIDFYIQSWAVDEDAKSNNLRICSEKGIAVVPSHYIFKCIAQQCMISFASYASDEYQNPNGQKNSVFHKMAMLANNSDARDRNLFTAPNVHSLETESIPQTLQEFRSYEWQKPNGRHILLLPIISRSALTNHKNENENDNGRKRKRNADAQRNDKRLKKKRKLSDSKWTAKANVSCESSSSESKVLSLIADFVSVYFQTKVRLLDAIELETDVEQDPERQESAMMRIGDKCFPIRQRSRSQSRHTQFEVCDMIDAVMALHLCDHGNDTESADGGYCVIGITAEDIFELTAEESEAEPESEWDVLRGRAFGGSAVAIFSTFSYLQMKEKDAVENQSLLMLCNTVAHELLHCFGIDHCVFYSCAMNAWSDFIDEYENEKNVIENETDGESLPCAVSAMHLCPVDLKKLHELVGFQVVERYESLLQFYQCNVSVFPQQYQWVKQMIECLGSKAKHNATNMG